jgi:hypothetical protein
LEQAHGAYRAPDLTQLIALNRQRKESQLAVVVNDNQIDWVLIGAACEQTGAPTMYD